MKDIGDTQWIAKSRTGGAELEHATQIDSNPDDTYDFNDIFNENSFLGHSIFEIPPDAPPLAGVPHTPVPGQYTIEHAADTAALELFNQMFIEHMEGTTRIAGYSLNQIADNGTQVPPQDIDTFSDRFLARAFELTHALHSQTPNDVPREAFHPNPLIRQAQRENELADLANSSSWLQHPNVPPQPSGSIDPLYSVQIQGQNSSIPQNGDWGAYINEVSSQFVYNVAESNPLVVLDERRQVSDHYYGFGMEGLPELALT